LKGFAAGVRRFAVSLGVVPTLLLIPSPEPLRAYERNFPPFFYRCDNGLTLVSHLREGDRKQGGEPVSEYPYPLAWRSRVLRRTSHRQYILVNGQEYDCKPWRHGDGDVFGIPDPEALREYAKRFNTSGRSRYICEGGHTVLLRITDFVDAGYRHGVMEVNDQEEVGLYFSRGTSGNFNGKGIRESGIAFAWGVRLDDDKRSVIRWFLNIDDDSFTCNRGGY